jgi:hypothetical protein
MKKTIPSPPAFFAGGEGWGEAGFKSSFLKQPKFHLKPYQFLVTLHDSKIVKLTVKIFLNIDYIKEDLKPASPQPSPPAKNAGGEGAFLFSSSIHYRLFLFF